MDVNFSHISFGGLKPAARIKTAFATGLHVRGGCAEIVAMTFSSTTAERIRARGGRATPARVKVLELLETRDQALSHAEVEQSLPDEGIDRVTLYRVLDWLVEAGLALRATDAARVFRFSRMPAAGPDHASHAHFHCEVCQQDFCLEGVPVPPAPLPGGFLGRTVEFNIGGCCDRCKDQE